MVPGVERVTDYLMTWADRARRAGGRPEDDAGRLLDAHLSRLYELVSQKLDGDAVLVRLEQGDPEGVDERRIRRRLQFAVEQAADEDEAFAAALGRMLSELAKAELAKAELAKAELAKEQRATEQPATEQRRSAHADR